MFNNKSLPLNSFLFFLFIIFSKILLASKQTKKHNANKDKINIIL